MRSLQWIVLFTIATFSGNAQVRESGSPAAQHVMKYVRTSVKDPGINNIEAVNFLIPAGWKTEGGIRWYPNNSILACLELSITDPETGATIQVLPSQNFTWLTQPIVSMPPGTNYLGNIVMQPTREVPQFIRSYYFPRELRRLQNARLVASEELPGVAEEISRANRGLMTAKAAWARYEYQIGSQVWEEVVSCTLTYVNTPISVIWSVQSACSFRAPKGQLDRMMPIMNTTVGTCRLSLDWFAGYMYVSQLFQERMAQGIRNAKALSDTVTANGEAIREMFRESYRLHSESQDRISQRFSEHIRGVETYNDPHKGYPVQLPSGYHDAWVNGKGEYILSNDANFNPNVADTAGWTRMSRQADKK